eukprot:jgi/Picsp_1/2478/NSC_00711-R1_phosphoribosylanthranilate isomerase
MDVLSMLPQRVCFQPLFQASRLSPRAPRVFGYEGSSRDRRRVCCESFSSIGEKCVKICGVVSKQDAAFAASKGADFIGMILWPKAGRSVSLETAKSIAHEAIINGSTPVGVFVDEDADMIDSISKEIGISTVQLHGDEARKSFKNLPERLRVIYVVHANSDGEIQTEIPDLVDRRPDWFLVDSLKGGSGSKFDWQNVKPPKGSHFGWLLAGGITDENVTSAIKIAQPDGVDVSSGVCDAGGLRKDPAKMLAYVKQANAAFAALHYE